MKCTLLLTFLSCLPLCHGYSAGPPDTVCTSMTPNHGANAQTSTAPYTITTSSSTYGEGDSITVTITATDPTNTPFKGFFIQARKTGSTDAVGSFSIGTATGIKLMTCSGGTNNAVSHSSSATKTSQSFVWSNTEHSDVTFQATILNTKTNYWMNVQSATLEGHNGASGIYYSLTMLVLLAVAVLLM